MTPTRTLLAIALGTIFNLAALGAHAAYVHYSYTDAAQSATTIASIEEQLTRLRTADTTTNETMSDLDTRLTAAETAIGTVDTRIAAAKVDVTGLSDLLAWYGEQDLDGDGFKGRADSCPDTKGVKAREGEAGEDDRDGCLHNTNSDKDPVADWRDACPGTTDAEAALTIIGENVENWGFASKFTAFDGCVDTDGDGTADKADKCAETSGDAFVNTNGCSEAQVLDKCDHGVTAMVKDDAAKVTLTTCDLAAPNEVLTCAYDKDNKEVPYSECSSNLNEG